jgi:hypothetical protein
MEHYNRLLEHDKRRFNNIMMQQQQMMRGRQDFEVVDFNLNGNFNADGYIQIQTLIIIILSSPSLLLLHSPDFLLPQTSNSHPTELLLFDRFCSL